MATTISGTMLTPGVSRNNRLYTPAVIAKTVERMQGRLADPDALPIVMRTHHAAGDNTRHIVGKVTSVDLAEDGSATYRAVLNDTVAGADVQTLISGDDPTLRSVSIFGWWNGDVRKIKHEGRTVEAGDDLEVDAVDFTAFPGVPAARIDSVTTEAQPSEAVAPGRHLVTESITADIEPPVEEAAMSAQAINDLPDDQFAYIEPGGEKDDSGKTTPRSKRHFPINDAAHVRAALARAPQSPFGAKAMSKIRAAAKKFGIKVAGETLDDGAPISEAVGETRLSEVAEFYGDDPDEVVGFSITAWNGPLTVAISAHCGIEPENLPAVAQAAMAAACDAIKAMDPDLDADIDTGQDDMTEADTTGPDDEMESLTVPAVVDADGATINTTELIEAASRPDPRSVAAAINRKNHPHETAEETVQPAEEPLDMTEEQTIALIEAALDRRAQTTPATDAGDDQPTTMEESAMSDTATTAVEQAAPTRNLTDGDVAALAAALGETFAKVLPQPAPAEAAAQPAEETVPAEMPAVSETAPALTAEALKGDLKAAAQEALKDAIPAILNGYGLPYRKGFRTTAETKEDMSVQDMWERRGDLMLGDYGKQAG